MNIRALSVYESKGTKLSEIFEKQETGTKTGSLRYLNPLIFWVKCDIDG